MQIIVGGPEVVLKVHECPKYSREILGAVRGLVKADPDGWANDSFKVLMQFGQTVVSRKIPAGIVQIVVSPEIPEFACAFNCLGHPHHASC